MTNNFLFLKACFAIIFKLKRIVINLDSGNISKNEEAYNSYVPLVSF